MGSATDGYRMVLPNSRHEMRGGVSASCQKMAETMGECGAVLSYDGLQGNSRKEGREGSVASYRGLPGGVRDEGRWKGYH